MIKTRFGTRQKITSIILVLFLAAAVALADGMAADSAYAASGGYKCIPQNGETVKVGKLYFKYSANKDKYRYSTRKSSGFKTLRIRSGLETENFCRIATNGKRIVYMCDTDSGKSGLVRENIKTGEWKTLKTLPKSEKYSYELAGAAGARVYITRYRYMSTCSAFMYSMNTGKYKRVKKNCRIEVTCGKYAAADSVCKGDASPTRHTLYRMTTKGLKKIRIISKRTFRVAFVKGRLYYDKYSGKGMRKASLYKSRANGSKSKKLCTFSSKKDTEGQVYFSNIRAKKCDVTIDGKEYTYIYKTKKLRKK